MIHRMLAHIVLPVVLLWNNTPAHAQDWTQEINPEFQFGATLGGGWYDLSIEHYQSGIKVESGSGMGVSFGAMTRVGLSTRDDDIGLMLALQGDLLSASDTHERFLLAAISGLFGLKIPVFRDGRSSVLLGGVLGLGFSNHSSVNGAGISYGGIAQYRFDHLYLEARYQRWAFDADAGLPMLNADLTIHQLLGSVGLAL